MALTRFGDVLRWPGIGPFLRWRWGRAVLQVWLLFLAGWMLYDAFTGPRQPHRNLATVLAWVHFRGLLILALLLGGNLFCMACPFTLTRSLFPRLSMRGPRWPRFLRTKWPAIATLFLLFFLYEWWDLWASPRLTGWVALAYFVVAFVLEVLFQDSPFCKYICPLGQFNFVHAALSPTEIRARALEVCRTCPGHECVRGSPRVAGCGTLLYVPQMRGNLDCTQCLDCVRACPYDNVALALRPNLAEVIRPDAWPHRMDVAFLVWMLLAVGLSNAFGMVAPARQAEAWLAQWGLRSEGLRLFALFAGMNLALPFFILWMLGVWTRRWSGGFLPWSRAAASLVPAFIPLSFGIWAAHYGFHFLSTAWVVVPVVQEWLLEHGLSTGTANWTPHFLLPPWAWFPLQVLLVLAGLAATLWALRERARRVYPNADRAALLFPWVAVALFVAWAALVLFSLPMEMRGMPSGH